MHAEVISGDLGLAGLRRLIDGRGTRHALHRQLSDMAPALPERRRLHRRRVTWKPGRNARVSFDLTLAGSIVPIQLRWLLDRTEAPPSDVCPADLPVGLALGHAAAGLFRRGDGSAGGGRVLVWPVDPDRPQLAELVESRMEPLLGIVGTGSAATIEVVRYRPGQRHVLAVTGSAARVFVKIGRPSEVSVTMARAAAVERAMSPLAMQFARAVWASESLGAVAYGALPGIPLRRLVSSRSSRSLPALAATGSMLAGVHRAMISDPAGPGSVPSADRTVAALTATSVDLPRLEPARETAGVLRAADYVAVLAPDAYRMAENLANQALDVLTEAAPCETTLLHHDLKCDHLLVHRGALGVIDLDAVGWGDPASDVARLLADLTWWAPAPWRQAVRSSFVDGYGRNDPAFVRRVAAWEVLATIKQAARRIPVLDNGLSERFTDAVAAARSAMERAAGRRSADW